MKSLTIAQRITLGFAIVLVLVAALSFGSIVSLRSIKNTLPMLTEDALPGITAMGEITTLVSGIQLDVARHLMAATPEEKKIHEANMDTKRDLIAKEFETYEKTIRLDEDRQNFAKLKTAREEYIRLRGPVLELSRAGKYDEARDNLTRTLRPAYDTYIEVCKDTKDWNANFGRQGYEQIKQTDGSAINTALSMITGGGGVLDIGFTFFIARSIGKALTQVAAMIGADNVDETKAACKRERPSR